MNTTPALDGSVIRRNTQQRLRRFVFTVNNYTEEEYEALKTFAKTTQWFIMGKERGEQGTPHIQGACVLGTQLAFSTLKGKVGLTRAHIESMRGQPQASKEYCSKEDPMPFEHGTLPQPGKRTDIHDATDAIRDGASLRELAESNPVSVVKFSKGLMTLRSLLAKSRDPSNPPTIYWIHGPTGTGKSKFAYEYSMAYGKNEDDTWPASVDLKWFDGYDGQQVVLFDDFRPKEVSFSFFLRILDRYPIKVPIKGGFVNWNPKLILITTPYDIDKTFEFRAQHRAEDINQLKRRITRVFDISCTTDRSDLNTLLSTARNVTIDDNRSDKQSSSSCSTTEPLECSSCESDSRDARILLSASRSFYDLGED